jgi:hypothetical protein
MKQKRTIAYLNTMENNERMEVRITQSITHLRHWFIFPLFEATEGDKPPAHRGGKDE